MQQEIQKYALRIVVAAPLFFVSPSLAFKKYQRGDVVHCINKQMMLPLHFSAFRSWLELLTLTTI